MKSNLDMIRSTIDPEFLQVVDSFESANLRDCKTKQQTAFFKALEFVISAQTGRYNVELNTKPNGHVKVEIIFDGATYEMEFNLLGDFEVGLGNSFENSLEALQLARNPSRVYC
jgi:hypothetical protein